MRKRFSLIFFLALICSLVAYVTYNHLHFTKRDLAKLPPLESYRIDPYLKAVHKLQAIGQTRAFNDLLKLTQNDHMEDSVQIEILCRMLFTKRLDKEFTFATHGMPKWIGSTSLKDWPLTPIEIIDGVPFAITRVYGPYYGTVRNYFEYCMVNCDWSNYKFTTKTEQQKRDALAKLIASPKWKTPLNQDDLDWFESQIK